MKTACCLALGLVGALPLCAAEFHVATNGADYPYPPIASFAGLDRGRALKDLPWPLPTDYVGSALDAARPPNMGHIQGRGTGGK